MLFGTEKLVVCHCNREGLYVLADYPHLVEVDDIVTQVASSSLRGWVTAGWVGLGNAGWVWAHSYCPIDLAIDQPVLPRNEYPRVV